MTFSRGMKTHISLIILDLISYFYCRFRVFTPLEGDGMKTANC